MTSSSDEYGRLSRELKCRTIVIYSNVLCLNVVASLVTQSRDEPKERDGLNNVISAG